MRISDLIFRLSSSLEPKKQILRNLNLLILNIQSAGNKSSTSFGAFQSFSGDERLKSPFISTLHGSFKIFKMFRTGFDKMTGQGKSVFGDTLPEVILFFLVMVVSQLIEIDDFCTFRGRGRGVVSKTFLTALPHLLPYLLCSH